MTAPLELRRHRRARREGAGRCEALLLWPFLTGERLGQASQCAGTVLSASAPDTAWSTCTGPSWKGSPSHGPPYPYHGAQLGQAPGAHDSGGRPVARTKLWLQDQGKRLRHTGDGCRKTRMRPHGLPRPWPRPRQAAFPTGRRGGRHMCVCGRNRAGPAWVEVYSHVQRFRAALSSQAWRFMTTWMRLPPGFHPAGTRT